MNEVGDLIAHNFQQLSNRFEAMLLDSYLSMTIQKKQIMINVAESTLSLSEVMSIAKVSRSTIFNWMKRGKFPNRIKLGERTIAWSRIEVEEWLKLHRLGIIDKMIG